MCKLACASPVVLAAGGLRWVSCELEILSSARHSLICLLGLPEASERSLENCLTFLMPSSCRYMDRAYLLGYTSWQMASSGCH